MLLPERAGWRGAWCGDGAGSAARESHVVANRGACSWPAAGVGVIDSLVEPRRAAMAGRGKRDHPARVRTAGGQSSFVLGHPTRPALSVVFPY